MRAARIGPHSVVVRVVKGTSMSRSLLAGAILGASSLVLAAPQPDESLLATQGEYVARLADCVACHTAPGGPPLAGGHAR